MKWGKIIGQWIVTAIFASIIVMILGWLYNAIAGSTIIGAGILAIILVAVLLITSMAISPGKESFMHLLPVLLIVSAIIGAIGLIWPTSPFKFVVELTLVGLALALSSVILANSIANKIMSAL